MYLPEAIERQVRAPGGFLTGASSFLSVVLAGVALGWTGVLVVLGILVLLIVIEIIREAARLRSGREDLERELGEATKEAKTVPALRSRVKDLQAAVHALEEEKRRPKAGFEETLEALAIHVSRMELVLKHRSMDGEVSVIPITRAAITEDGYADVSGVSERGADLLRGEPLMVMRENGEEGGGLSEATRIDGAQVQAQFTLEGLPGDLAGLIEQRGSLNPQGYTLRLAGLCMAGYEGVSDAELTGLRDSIKEAMDALARTLTLQQGPVEDDQAMKRTYS
jgi:hypothetical protein